MTLHPMISFGNIQWRILVEQPDRMLLLADDIVALRDYHSKSEDTTWANGEIRHYLNHDFYLQFSPSEQANILLTCNQNNGNPWYHTLIADETWDKIFLLSLDEVVRDYFGDSSSLLDFPLPKQRYWFQRKDVHNEQRCALFLGSPWWWWLRTAGKNQRTAIYIHGDGNVGIQGNGVGKRHVNVIHPVNKDSRGGIRPALWLKK